MLLPFQEPTAPRYIYINPDNNLVHLLVPMYEVQKISIRKLTLLYKFFMEGAALRELNAYQSALEFDLQFLDSSHLLKLPKQQRLNQIKEYIKAISVMVESYENVITKLMQIPYNLYSVQLRPSIQGPQSHVVNPLFYPNNTLAALDPKAQLNKAVLALLPEQPVNFEDIQRVLTEQCQRLFGLNVNFTQASNANVVNKASIDALMGFTPENPATTQDYIGALLRCCALNLFDTISTSPFYRVQNNPNKTAILSILTQFFLAHVGIYCAANEISRSDFEELFNKLPSLSNVIPGIVSSALNDGNPVEERLCTFFNEHANEFGMTRPLTLTDSDSIKQKFNTTYTTMVAAENSRMEGFMILDTSPQIGKFATHQGSICTDFAELIDSSLDNDYFKKIRSDFEAQYIPIIPDKNEHIKASIDLSIEALLSRCKDHNQFKKLPPEIQNECMQSPLFQLRTFLHYVAQGKQDDAQGLLKEKPEVQTLLSTPETFTDYSGRTFNCTVYEYAYWAKDTHMCRMLEHNMDENTKALMLKCVDAIEEQGLRYNQNGKECCSKHFDFTPLKTALTSYIKGCVDNWERTGNLGERLAAWKKVGLAQRDVPVHVINEYCRPDRSFKPIPTFIEEKLPRVVTFYKYGENKSLFPLGVSDSDDLGVGWALIRFDAQAGVQTYTPTPVYANIDLVAVSRLDEVRTDDLTQSRENLKLIQPGKNLGM